MRGYPDGMKRHTLFAALAACAWLALPATAAAPTGWHAGRGVSGSFTTLTAASESVAVAAGFDGAVARTTDAGTTWSRLAAPSPARVRDIAEYEPGTIFSVDSTGAAQRSTDAGASWTPLTLPDGLHALGVAPFGDGRVVVVGPRALLLSTDRGDSFESVTPKLAATDVFKGLDRAGPVVLAFGSKALLVSDADGRVWKHMRLPALERGDGLLAVDFVAPRVGFVLTSFRRLFRTVDGGHHWRELLGAGGAGADLAFASPRTGYLAAPGLAGRFDGYVLRTTDGGLSWRPQSVAPRFLSKVATASTNAFAIANEGTGLFANRGGEEPGKALTVGFRPEPRRARRGDTVVVRGRIAPRMRAVGVIVSMRSAGRWIARYVRTDGQGVFTAKFAVQRRAWFVAQVPGGGGHGSAATKAVYVPVTR